MTSQWDEGDVVTNGVRLHYYRTGSDKPAALKEAKTVAYRIEPVAKCACWS